MQQEEAFGDLEKPITDVSSMAEIVVQMMREHGSLEAGDVTINQRSWETFLVRGLSPQGNDRRSSQTVPPRLRGQRLYVRRRRFRAAAFPLLFS